MEVDLPEDDWLSEHFTKAVVVSRKRKLRKTVSSSDYFSDSSDLEDVVDSTDSYAQNKIPRLMDTLYSGASATLANNYKYVERLIKYLSRDDLKSVAQVSKLWQIASTTRMLIVQGNRPFTHLWKSNGPLRRFSMNRFALAIKNSPNPIQAILFTSTSSLEEIDLGIDSGFLSGVACSAIFSDKLVITAPDYSFVSDINNFQDVHAIQALCIPESNRIQIKRFSIPVWSTINGCAKINEEQLCESIMKTYVEAPANLTLKGMTLFTYQEDAQIDLIVSKRLNLERNHIPLVGGVVYNILTNDTPSSNSSPVASGWAIFGDANLKISTIALEVHDQPKSDLTYCHIQEHFHKAENGFIIVLYKNERDVSHQFTEFIRERVPRIPLVGIQTVVSFGLQGNISFHHPGDPGSSLSYPANKNSMENIRVICLLVSY